MVRCLNIPFCLLFTVLLMMLAPSVKAQEGQNVINADGYNVFYYPNGIKSSEGIFRNGKPDGYWKTYYENGLLKSEGNRKNFELDSLWKFYDDSSRLILTINYSGGKKNGLKTTYRPGETMTENYEDDIKQGLTTYYYPDGKVKLTIPYVNGLEQGFAREYAPDGTVITYMEYKKGFMISRERINRKDKDGLRQGRWKVFYPSGIVQLDGVYRNDKKNGYFKEYDENGQLLSVKKFVNDTEEKEAPELTSLSIKTDYYPDGKVKTVASYNGEVPQGVRREYDETGKITAGYVFHKGSMVGEGIIDEEGIKDGPWKEYYDDGTLRSAGSYDKGNRIGEWKFYYENGKIEEQGRYNKKGNPDGTWQWYYDDGTLRREESFIAGLEDGDYSEYDETGKLMVKGNYVEGLEEGEWMYDFGDYKEQGPYKGGARNGFWKSWYPDGTLRFEGGFIDDNYNGKIIWYWPDGKRKDEGNYVNGSREGDWITYNEDGTPFLVITYKNDVEKKYDGVLIKPPFEE